jgi:hypothetical protein
MNTTKLNGTEYTLTEGEGGKIILTPIIKQPEKREPEAGDVWQGFSGSDWLVGESRATLDAEGIHHFGYHMHSRLNPCRATHLGKFDEVYVKIADVRAALSHKDVDGEDMLDYFNQEFKFEEQNYGAGESFKALRKLNIITD